METKGLITADEIKRRVEGMADHISEDYIGEHLTLIGILSGSVILVADLVRALKLPTRIGFLRARLAYVHDFFKLGRSFLNALLSRGPVRGILGSLARRAARAAAPR